jgi:hypothetical protein
VFWKYFSRTVTYLFQSTKVFILWTIFLVLDLRYLCWTGVAKVFSCFL